MDRLIFIVLATAGASWLWHNKREQVIAVARELRRWAEGQWRDPVARRRALIGGGATLAALGVLHLGGKLGALMDRLGQPPQVTVEASPPAPPALLQQPPAPIQSPGIMGGDWSGGFSGPGGRYSGLPPADQNPGVNLAGGFGGHAGPQDHPPQPDGPKSPGWLEHAERPAPVLPEVGEGLVWSVKAVSTTGEEPNVGHIAIDPDGIRVYSYSHDNNNAAMDTGVFVAQWRLDDGSLIWGQRMNGDLPPAFNRGNSHLFVYDAQPIQALTDRPVPGNSGLHPIWTLNRLMGGITGPLPTFPLVLLAVGGEDNAQYNEGICPRDRDVAGVGTASFTGRNPAADYFPNGYGAGFEHLEQATGVSRRVRRHLVAASVDVAHYGPSILAAGRHEPLVRAWMARTGWQQDNYGGHRRAVELIRTRTDMVLTADRNEVHYWNRRKPAETIHVAPLPKVARTCLEVTPGFDYAFLGTEQGELHVYDLTHGAFVGEPIRAHDGAVQDIAVSHDWRRVLTVGADGMLRCWGMPGLGPHAAPVEVTPDMPARVVAPESVAGDPPARGESGGAPEPARATPRKQYSGEFFPMPDYESAISLETYERVPILDLYPPDGRESAAREFAPFRAQHLARGGRIATPEDLEAIDRQLAKMRSYPGGTPPEEEVDELLRLLAALGPGGQSPGAGSDQPGNP